MVRDSGNEVEFSEALIKSYIYCGTIDELNISETVLD